MLLQLLVLLIFLGNEENNENSGEIIYANNEKTIDLYGTFDENDIEIERLEKKYDGVEDTIKIPQIRGLKNKEVEEKVNKDIEKRIDEKIEEIKAKGGQDINNIKYYGGYYGEDGNIYRGFSNVISFDYLIPYTFEKKESYSDNEIEKEKIYFNYELVNGERLKFEDLFTKNTDVISIVRRAFYRTMSREISCLGTGLFLDKEKNVWLEELFDDKEYTPVINENDINKRINNFIKNGKQEFYFTPSTLYIGNEEYISEYIEEDKEEYFFSFINLSDYIELKDIVDEVVIYDKYLTEESIYEKDNIGYKNLWTCANVNLFPYNTYQEYGFAEDNLFYEVNVPGLLLGMPDNYPFKNSISKIIVKLAQENKDKFYIVYLYVPSIDYNTDNMEKNSYLISSNISEKIVPVDISYKKDVIDEIIEFYRYYDNGFYNFSGLDFGLESLISNKKYNIENADRKEVNSL